MRDVRPAAPSLVIAPWDSIEASSHAGGGLGGLFCTPQEYDSGRRHQVGIKNLALRMMEHAT